MYPCTGAVGHWQSMQCIENNRMHFFHLVQIESTYTIIIIFIIIIIIITIIIENV